MSLPHGVFQEAAYNTRIPCLMPCSSEISIYQGAGPVGKVGQFPGLPWHWFLLGGAATC